MDSDNAVNGVYCCLTWWIFTPLGILQENRFHTLSYLGTGALPIWFQCLIMQSLQNTLKEFLNIFIGCNIHWQFILPIWNVCPCSIWQQKLNNLLVSSVGGNPQWLSNMSTVVYQKLPSDSSVADLWKMYRLVPNQVQINKLLTSCTTEYFSTEKFTNYPLWMTPNCNQLTAYHRESFQLPTTYALCIVSNSQMQNTYELGIVKWISNCKLTP